MSEQVKQELDIKQQAKEKLEQERLKANDKKFADLIIGYLQKRCEEDQGMAEDVMQEGKTWKKCIQYVANKFRKQAFPIASNVKCAPVDNDTVYELAEDYYHKEEKPEIAKREKGKKPETTKKTETPTKKVTETKKDIQQPKDDTKVSEKPVKNDAASKQRKTEKTSTKNSELSGQMSLFDFL